MALPPELERMLQAEKAQIDREEQNKQPKAEQKPKVKGKPSIVSFNHFLKRKTALPTTKRTSNAFRGILSAGGVIQNENTKSPQRARRIFNKNKQRTPPQIRYNKNLRNTQRLEVLADYYRRQQAQKRTNAGQNQQLSENTQRILNEVMRVQNLGHNAIQRQARIHRERQILSNAMNLMKAHENMTPMPIDFAGVQQDNILLAKNIWREQPQNFILKPKKINILSGENRLRFF